MYEEKHEAVAEGHIDAGRNDGIQQSPRSTHQSVNIIVPTGLMDQPAAPVKVEDVAQQVITLGNTNEIEVRNEQPTEVAAESKLPPDPEREQAEDASLQIKAEADVVMEDDTSKIQEGKQ